MARKLTFLERIGIYPTIKIVGKSLIIYFHFFSKFWKIYWSVSFTVYFSAFFNKFKKWNEFWIVFTNWQVVLIISFKSLLKIDHFRAIGKLFRIIFPIFMVKNQNACVENSISWKNKKKCQKKKKWVQKITQSKFPCIKSCLLM